MSMKYIDRQRYRGFCITVPEHLQKKPLFVVRTGRGNTGQALFLRLDGTLKETYDSGSKAGCYTSIIEARLAIDSFHESSPIRTVFTEEFLNLIADCSNSNGQEPK